MGDHLDEAELLKQAAAGDLVALNLLLERNRERLRRMVRLRINHRLRGRLDESDVLQESFLEITKRLPQYLEEPKLPFYLWVRHMAGLKLAEAHRRHFHTKARSIEREFSLDANGFPSADSASLAGELAGRLSTPSQAAVKAELRAQVQQALEKLDPIDREVLGLKHFEQLSTSEIATVLGLSKAGAGSRYLRAIKRLRQLLAEISGTT